MKPFAHSTYLSAELEYRQRQQSHQSRKQSAIIDDRYIKICTMTLMNDLKKDQQ